MVVLVADHMIGSLGQKRASNKQKQPLSCPEHVYLQFWLPSVYLPTSDIELTYLLFDLLYT